eukprot:m51a1_g3587 hypothetical protein (334) ;mRNA; f:1152109-1153619
MMSDTAVWDADRSVLHPFKGIEADCKDCWPGSPADAPLFSSANMLGAIEARVFPGSVLVFHPTPSSPVLSGVVFSIHRRSVDVVVFGPEPRTLSVCAEAVVDVAGPASGPLREKFVQWAERSRVIPSDLMRLSELSTQHNEALCDLASLAVAETGASTASSDSDVKRTPRKRAIPEVPFYATQGPAKAPRGRPVSPDDSPAPAAKTIKRPLPEEAKAVLRQWVSDHSGSTRPTIPERRELSVLTGLTVPQIETWFRHYRVRDSMHVGPEPPKSRSVVSSPCLTASKSRSTSPVADSPRAEGVKMTPPARTWARATVCVPSSSAVAPVALVLDV